MNFAKCKDANYFLPPFPSSCSLIPRLKNKQARQLSNGKDHIGCAQYFTYSLIGHEFGS